MIVFAILDLPVFDGPTIQFKPGVRLMVEVVPSSLVALTCWIHNLPTVHPRVLNVVSDGVDAVCGELGNRLVIGFGIVAA